MYCKFKKTWFRNVWAMKKVLIPGSSIGIILLAAVMSLTFTGCAPTAEQLRAQELFNQTQMDTWRSVGLIRKEIQVDSHRIVYLEGGRGRRCCFLHGFACDKSYWTYFAEPLIRDYHVVIPDLAGFGESTKQLGASYNIDSQVKRLERFAEVLHLERFHLAGNSMGDGLRASIPQGSSENNDPGPPRPMGPHDRERDAIRLAGGVGFY